MRAGWFSAQLRGLLYSGADSGAAQIRQRKL